MKFGRSWCVVLILLLGLGLTGVNCEPEEVEEFDREALMAVNEYVKAMTVALLDVIPDLKGWVRDYYEEDLPLRYDEERRQWLAEHLEEIERIGAKRRERAFPADADISTWEVAVVQSDREWLLEGPEALAALEQLQALKAETSAVLRMVIEDEGELDMDQSERVLTLIDRIEPEVEAVRAYFFR